MRSPPWNDQENRALVALYFAMLDAATAPKLYNKAAMIRTAKGEDPDGTVRDRNPAFYGLLGLRSRGSIEAKLMNVSACHRDLTTTEDHPAGATTMDGYGYRCLSNYQADLKKWTLEAIEERQLDADIATSQANEQRAGA